MKPESQSYNLLGMTRSKAKMFEYGVLEEFHLQLYKNPLNLFTLCIGIIGDYSRDNGSEATALTAENREKLLFAAQFFDSIIGSKLNAEHKNYFFLVGAAAYYLVDLPGSASVLAKQITEDYNFESEGLDLLLIWLLQNDLSVEINFGEFQYSASCEKLYNAMKQFVSGTNNEADIVAELDELCDDIYENGTDRQLLFADIIRSIFKKRLFNSTRNSLVRYSTLNIDEWQDTMMKPTFVKEFWPAQKLLGEKNIFNGKSGVIQMPTSSGKTKSIEIIIRSSFLSGRSEMAVIIAPFRALCAEIKSSLQLAFKYEAVIVDEPSDAMQPDYDPFEALDGVVLKKVLIITPEKFIYMLRTQPEISSEIGLLIYDEGHQFDNGIRGVTYELLLSSLKSKVSPAAQIILISAVISNGQIIGDWLINNEKEIIADKNLLPTYRTVAFATWTTILGQLMFVKDSDPEQGEYFVPRILEAQPLILKGRETKIRNFPEKDDGKDIALFLALKLVPNGSAAIFCGSKVTVRTMCSRIIEIINRGYEVATPVQYSDHEEIDKLVLLHKSHFGADYVFCKCAELGVFTHSSNTPEGLRLAIEYALQLSKIKVVICTSTLAQGVNLPIRYLLITSFYQAGNKIKNRDFHNLIGRAGRSGMYTEGSIIFTDPELYDQKESFRDGWKWRQAKELLDPNNTEPCGSTLLTIFDPLYNEGRNYWVDIPPIDLVKMYLENSAELEQLPADFVTNNPDNNFTIAGLAQQINFKIQIIAALESYIMAYWDDYSLSESIDNVDNITTETLAYLLADDTQKAQLIELFKILAINVSTTTTPTKRISFGRTLLGLEDLKKIEEWILDNLDDIRGLTSPFELFKSMWPLIYQMSDGQLKKIVPEANAYILSDEWITGRTYEEILKKVVALNTKYVAGTQLRELDQDFVIDVCHSNFSYGITLVIGAACQVIAAIGRSTNEDLITALYSLQKNIKYGLPNQLAIAFYELGFSDRVIAIELSETFENFSISKTELIEDIIFAEDEIREVLGKYPSYFESILDELI